MAYLAALLGVIRAVRIMELFFAHSSVFRDFQAIFFIVAASILFSFTVPSISWIANKLGLVNTTVASQPSQKHETVAKRYDDDPTAKTCSQCGLRLPPSKLDIFSDKHYCRPCYLEARRSNSTST